MGLDTTHDCWHGAYSAFNRWRVEVARAAGLPPLELMEGFFTSRDGCKGIPHGIPTIYLDHNASDLSREAIGRIEERLPISWGCLKPDALHFLLNHSDCDGEIPADACGAIADRLAEILPLMPEGGGGGHIRDWRAKTQQFIDGLRKAAAAGEAVEFH